MQGSFVVPGDELGSIDKYVSGCGTYPRDNVIRASLCGKVVMDVNEDGKQRINVTTPGSKASDFIINVGDKVLCRVMKSNYNQAYVEILSVGDNRLPFPSKGVIRREDIREKDVDKIVIHEHFMGGDVVKASVLSLGDSKQYYLSTMDVGLGVIMRTQT
jgi:exosome complex component CSL4